MQVIPVNTNFRITRTIFDDPLVFILTRFYCNSIYKRLHRSVTEESCVFVRSMVEDKIDVYKAYKLLQAAGKVHSLSSKQALVGQGIDRHLFALYVTSTLKGIHSEFLENAMNIPFKISTSQVSYLCGYTLVHKGD